jgi:CheY-like chemotaxis protein
MPRVLVIDDDDDMRAMLDQTLKSAGFESLLAADGLEGIQQLRSASADAVITDLFMPNQEGIETIREIRKFFPDIPIVAMSGKALGPSMLPIAEKLGAVAVLHKPFTPEELLATLARVLPAP